MASLETLPADQRAVLQLVLRQGRSYDEIARLLKIDRAAVRDRALAGFDALGPSTPVSPESRSLITDYLLDQLPVGANEMVKGRLARSSRERAWARVLASELAPIARGPLPEIPLEYVGEEEVAPAAAPTRAGPQVAEAPEPAAAPPPSRPERRRSRRGGAILLGVGAAIVLIVVIVLVASGGSSSKHKAATASKSSSTTSTSASASSSPHIVSQINMVPTSAGSKAAGVAFVLAQGANTGIAIRAQNVPANTAHNAYAVWLYNSPKDAKLLGFVNPGVTSNGQLSTAGGLPANASHYKQILLTVETLKNPQAPGKILLQGTLTGV